jgi:hypothetical protein
MRSRTPCFSARRLCAGGGVVNNLIVEKNLKKRIARKRFAFSDFSIPFE